MPTAKPRTTKYENAKHHRIYLSKKGRPFTRVDGKRSYGAKAKFVSSNNGTVRKVTPKNRKTIPSAMRRVVRPGVVRAKTVAKPTAVRVARPSVNTKLKATRLFGAFLNRPRAMAKAKVVAKKQGYNARNNASIGMRNRKTAGKATLKARRNESKGMLKSKGKSPYADRKMTHRMRKLVGSPGGTLSKGMAAFTRALKKL